MLSLVFAALMLGQQPAAAVQQIEGAITPSDPAAAGEHYDAYPVELRGGQRVTISVRPRGSTQFGLSVHSRDGVQTLALAEGMQLGFTPRADGVYVVRIASDRTGGYTLRVADGPRR